MEVASRRAIIPGEGSSGCTTDFVQVNASE